MTHDPLCPADPAPVNVIRDLIASAPGGSDRLEAARQRRVNEAGEWCQCSLIANVRADERQRIIGVMERNSDGDAMKVIDAVLDMIFVPDHKNEYLNRDRGGSILGPILDHHPADPDKTRIMRDGKWVKP